MAHGTFATVISCVDGRVQMPVNRWLRKAANVEYVDTVTEAGPDGILAKDEAPFVDSIKRRVLISVNRHGSKTIAVIGHHDCAGDPGSESLHRDHIMKALEAVKGWNLGARLLGAYVDQAWEVIKVYDSEEK